MISDGGLVLYAIVSLVMSIFSSIAGGGSGFIITPLLIFLGLTPAQAIASGKFMGLSITLGNLRVTRKQKLHDWRVIMPLLIIAAVIGLTAPHLITKIEGDVYRKVIGILILFMIPVMYYKKLGRTSYKASPRRRSVGYVFVTAAIFMQSVFGSGMGMLVNLALVSFMGMNHLEATITKRFVQLLTSTLIVGSLLFSGLMVWKLIIVGVVFNFIGGTVGAHLAIKKGNVFVLNVLIVLMLLSGIALLAG